MKKYFTCFCFVVFGLLLGVFVGHNAAKKSYYDVGFNDGSIDANAMLITRISELNKNMKKCTKDDIKLAEEIVSVKAEAIYMIAHDDRLVYFCESQ